ncbi:DUF1289 domain-containing protein [Acinetobacter larvae]|uniref:DUF1289 domain-containing protein n=1 Tax=Acinetobacter larvae TaxID=1789224 RepID=A0A1B2M3T5_9GAMM|nr:DUF1289 domain-containing protein [Acinetobacter larvae]AOA59867.1 hypothetical protein BFG52_04240 [Acinetobacter larvae]
MTHSRRIATLTPCAGRCSTVFGDAVCRGCRRFNHEVIQWNGYDAAQRYAVWKRLDAQLDQILVPMLPLAQLPLVEVFLENKRIRCLETASVGRKFYLALKYCEKRREATVDSGLGLDRKQVKALWDEFERRVIALANASYDFAWLRADAMRQHLTPSQQTCDDIV